MKCRPKRYPSGRAVGLWVAFLSLFIGGVQGCGCYFYDKIHASINNEKTLAQGSGVPHKW